MIFWCLIQKLYILRRPQNFAKSPPYFCQYSISKVEISQNFVAFSEYMNFKTNGVTFVHLIWKKLENVIFWIKYNQSFVIFLMP